jgi:hypothetical protein
MRNIVLITRENAEEKITHVSVKLCDWYSETKLFCKFVNRLSLAGGEKLSARLVRMNEEHTLEKYIPFTFDDIVTLDNRTIQSIMSKLDSLTIAAAIKSANKKIKECFLGNMSKRSAAMLQEDIEYIDPASEWDIEDARQRIIDAYDNIRWQKYVYEPSVNAYKAAKKSQPDQDSPQIVLVFHGADDTADKVSVTIFDSCESADNFRDFINNLKPDKNEFVYARRAEETVEYEITRPLLIRFNQLFDYPIFSNKYIGGIIIREALNKFSPETLLQAMKGLDKHFREIIMQSLPTKTTDVINELINDSDKYNSDYCTLEQTRQAQQKIMNAINAGAKKAKKGAKVLKG